MGRIGCGALAAKQTGEQVHGFKAGEAMSELPVSFSWLAMYRDFGDIPTQAKPRPRPLRSRRQPHGARLRTGNMRRLRCESPVGASHTGSASQEADPV